VKREDGSDEFLDDFKSILISIYQRKYEEVDGAKDTCLIEGKYEISFETMEFKRDDGKLMRLY